MKKTFGFGLSALIDLSSQIWPNPLCPLFNTHFQEREPWIENPFFCPRHFFRWPYPPPLRNTRSGDELADHRAKSKHAWTFFSSEPYRVAPSKGFKITVMPANFVALGTNVMFKAGFSRHHGKDHWRAQSLSVKFSVSSAWDQQKKDNQNHRKIQ